MTYDGGTSGGTLTNCAHLTTPGNTVTSGGFRFSTVAALNLQACDTQTIGAHVCTPGTVGCGWKEGDMLTFTQSAWGDPASAAGAVLAANYNSVYRATGGVLEVGIAGSGGFSMTFTVADAVLFYLPAIGTSGQLTSDLIDPSSSSSGDFGGELVALALNIDFSDAGALPGSSALGDLRICGFGPLPVLNGMTVRQFFGAASILIGGGSASFNESQGAVVASFINFAFFDGAPSTFAQDNLVNGTCP